VEGITMVEALIDAWFRTLLRLWFGCAWRLL
jgi:hypothetical protein